MGAEHPEAREKNRTIPPPLPINETSTKIKIVGPPEQFTLMRKEFDQPSSLEAEKAVLGGLLLKPDLWDTVSVTVDEKDFILLEHQLIYRAIRRLRDHGSEIDTVTLIESLTSDPDISSLSNFNQNEYIRQLAKDTPGTANFDNYTDIVKQTSNLRKLISTASDISNIAKDSDTFEIEDLLVKLKIN